MANCSHTYKGEKSILYDTLWNLYHDDAIAHTAWEKVRSPEFLNKYGDWTKDYTMGQVAAMDAKELYKKINKLEEPTDARGLALSYLSGGGQISPESLYNEVITRRDPRIVPTKAQTEKEVSSRDYVKKGKASIKDVAHSLWQSLPEHLQDTIDTEQIRNALIDTIGDYNTRYEAAGKYWEEYGPEEEKQTPKKGQIPLDANGEPEADWVRKELKLPESKLLPISTGTNTTEATEVVTRNFNPGKNEGTRTTTTRDGQDVLLNSIASLYDEATANKDKTFYVDHNATDTRRFHNGYTPMEMAALLDSLPIPGNVKFHESMQKLIFNSPRRIKEAFDQGTIPTFMSRNEQQIQRDAALFMIPKLDKEGKPVTDSKGNSFFSPKEQGEVVGSLVKMIHSKLVKDPNIGKNAVLQTLYDIKTNAENKSGKVPAAVQEQFGYIYQVRTSFIEQALHILEGLGLQTDNQSRLKILEAVQAGESLSEVDKRIEDTAIPHSLSEDEEFTNEQLQGEAEFVEAAGRGLKDWGEVSFELDPKDTASARMKMFIATLPQMDRAVYTSATSDKAAITVPASYDINDPATLQRIALNVNRQPFFYKDDASTKALADLLQKQVPFVQELNFLRLPKLVDFEATFQKVLETLVGVEQNFDSYLQALQASKMPVMQTLAKELSKESLDQGMKNEFATVMSKQYQQFIMMLFNRIKGENGQDTWVLNPINANRYTQKNSIVKNWQEEQKLSELIKVDGTGNRIMDVKRVRERWVGTDEKPGILSTIQKWLNNGATLSDFLPDGSIALNQKGQWAKTQMTNVLRLSGVDLSDEMVDYLFDKIGDLSPFGGGLEGQFTMTKDGKPNGLFSAFILQAAGMELAQEMNEQDLDEETLDARAQSFNPLYNRKLMDVFSTVAARFTPVLYSGSHKSSEGKNVWDYGLHTKLSHKMGDMLNHFDDFFKVAQDKHISKNNWLMEALASNPELLKNIKLSYLDGLKPTWGKRGTTRTKMSNREQLLMSLALFQNHGRGFSKNSKVHFIDLTHSDKTTTPVLMNMPRFNTGTSRDKYNNIIGGEGTPFYNIMKAEWMRIINGQKTNFNDARYDGGKHLFYFFPQLNYDAMKDAVGRGELTNDEFKTIWVGGTRTLAPVINNDKELVVINKILTRSANDRVRNTKLEWEKEGIINEKELTTMFDKDYVKELLFKEGIRQEKGFDGVSKVWTDKFGHPIQDKDVFTITTLMAARDYALNYFLFNTTMSQLFYGDPAETYKGKSGTHDLVQVDSTMKEYAKRLAKDIAPGIDPYWGEKKSYNTITIADVKTLENYVPESLQKAYVKVEATDAQELTTVQEHIDVMYAQGKLSKKVYNGMTEIITKAGPGGYYTFEDIPEYKSVIMQPSKPVYAGNRAVQNGVQLEDYVKSSSYPLYPPEVAGTEHDKLRQFMEKNNIQRANYESAKKIGAPATPAKVFDDKGNFTGTTDELTPDHPWSSAVQTLDRSGFRIQQEVPYDEEKEAIKTVTQMNKLIVEGIQGINGFKIGSQTMSGEQVRQYKEDLRKQMIGQHLDELLHKLGVDPAAYRKGKGNIDTAKVYSILAEEARKKGYTINELQSILLQDKNGEPLIPLMLNPAADRLESLMMSMVKKVATIKMPGKSFVQASSVGYSFTDESKLDKSKVVWLGDYDGSMLKTVRSEGGSIKPAQVLLPFNFFDSEGNKLNVMDFAKQQNGHWVIDDTKLPDELRQLVGARIPNQGHNSMLPIEVVGFLPANMGDRVIVPAGITKQMGADFDVDKLYTYKRPYTYDKETGTLRTLPEHKTESQHKVDFLRESMPEATDEELLGYEPTGAQQDAIDKSYAPYTSEQHLQNEYFNVHWGVLTHEQMLEKILRPLDKPDLEDENTEIKKRMLQDPTVNYYDTINQLNDFQSGKEAKMGVALSSLAVVFNTVIQDKNLYLLKAVMQEGKDGKMHAVPVPDSITVLDDDNNPIILSELSGNGTTTYKGELRTKHDNQSTIQSGYVDNAKNRTMDNLNLTSNTFPAAQAFLQLQTKKDKTGDAKIVDLRYVTRLLTQPIIKEFDAMMKKGNDSLSNGYTQNLKQTVIDQLYEKYGNGETTGVLRGTGLSTPLSPQQMLQQSPDIQIAALALFEKLDGIGSRMRELQSLFNQDTNGAGPNILTSLDKQEKLNNIGNKIIIGGEEDLYGLTTRTEQGYTYDATIGVANTILTQILPYDQLSDMLKAVTVQSSKERLSIDQQRNVVRAMRSFIYSQDSHWWQNASEDRARLLYGNRNEKSLAQRLLDAKRTWGKDNYFLQRLNPKFAEVQGNPEYVEYQAAQVGRIDEDNNVRSWMSILMEPNEEHRKLGEDLLRYAYLTGGIQDANSFVKFVPIAYIVNTPFGEMLRNSVDQMMSKEGQPFMQPGFMEQFFQHNPELAPSINQEQLKVLVPGLTSDYPEAFFIPNAESEESEKAQMLNYFGKDPENPGFAKFISFRSPADGKWILYSNVGDMYQRIDTLGNSHSDEYNGNSNSAVRSLFPENRALLTNGYEPAMKDIENLRMNNYGGVSKGVTVYDQIGMKEGGMEAVQATLDNLIHNQNVKPLFNEVANFLKIANNDRELNSAIQATGVPFNLQVKFNSEIAAKGNANFNGLIQLNPKQAKDINDAAKTFLHELGHTRLQSIIAVAGLDPRFSDSDAVYKWREQHPEAFQHLQAVNQVRKDYLAYLEKTMGRDAFLAAQEKINTNAAITESEKRVYAASSLQEFVTHLMVEEKIQRELNDIKSDRNVSFLQRIWDALSKLFTSLGFKVKDNSLLQEGLIHTMSLLDTTDTRSMDIGSALTNNAPLVVNSRTEANSLQQLLQQSYERNSSLENMGTGWKVQLVNNSSASVLKDSEEDSKIIRMSNKLNQQLRKAYNDIQKAETVEQRVKARTRYHDLRENLNELKRDKNMELITKNGKEQLKWVDSIIAQPNPAPSDVFTAIDTVKLWGGLLELLYGDTEGLTNTPKEFGEVQQMAQERRIQLMNVQARNVTAQLLSGKKIELTTADFGKALEDINGMEALFRTAYTSKQAITAAIGAAGFQQANNRDEHIARTAADIIALQEQMKNLKIRPDHFLHADSWTLVDRLSPEWYDFRRTADETRDRDLEGINTSEGVSDEVRMENRAIVWKEYWDNIRKHAAFVDTRTFFDFTDGSRKTGDKVDAAFEDLKKTVGNEEYAHELVKQAHELFQNYIEERELYRNYIKGEIELTEEEGKDKTDEEKATLLKAKVEGEVTKWIQQNSPTEFLNRMNPKSNSRFMNSGDRWIVMAPRADIRTDEGESRFYDEKYESIQKDEKVKSVYEDYKKLVQEMISYLPMGDQEKLNPNFLPIVSVDTVNSLATMVGKIRNWDSTLLNLFTATEAEEFARLRPDEIPIMYTRKTSAMKDKTDKKGNVIRKATMEQSRDPFRTLEVFSMMALHYHYMAPVLDKIRVAQQVLQVINEQRIGGTAEGKPLTNTLDVVKYFMDSLIFKKPKELQGKADHDIYSFSPATQNKIKKEIEELVAEAKKLNEESAAATLDGDYEASAKALEKLGKINQKLDDYRDMARHIYGSKALDALITMNQIKSLSYNPFSAVTNMTFGLISLSVHANGRVDFEGKHLRKAYSIMTNSMKKYFFFGTSDSPTAQKIMHLMHRSGVMTEIANTQLEESNLTSHKGGAIRNSLTPFNWQRSGDYYAKGSMMVAMMLKQQVDVEENGVKKKISLWEALDDKGRWNTEKYGANPSWYSENISEQQDWNNFRDKMRGVAMIVFGNQDKNSPMLAKKSMLWRLAGQFRMSWLPEGIASRWQSERPHPLLGRTVKGRWRSAWDIGLCQTGIILCKQLLSTIPGTKINPFEGVKYTKNHETHSLISEDGVESVDVENMRKNFSGLMWTIAMAAIVMSLKALAPDEKGKKKDGDAMRAQLLLNLLIRNYQDLSLYASPDVFNQVSGNFLPATQVLTDTYKALKATGTYMTHPNDRDAFNKWFNKVSRTMPVVNLIPKTKYMVTRPLDAISK